MDNATRIGRIGALAVALGIGAALAATPWAASANPTESTASSDSASSSSTAVGGQPSDGTGPCSSACEVGSEGQGGEAGNAQGGYVKRPATFFPNTTIRSAGPADSGIFQLSGATQGFVGGHIHDRETGDFTGRLTGIESPNLDGSPCTGRCNIG